MKRVFHLGVGGTTITPAGIEEIEKVLNSAADWYRNGAYSWFVYADESLDYWRDRLRATSALSEGKASFFLSEVTRPYSGYLLEGGWIWLKSKI
jgi:hypothetical protein